jgi:serine/threonine protein kinase
MTHPLTAPGRLVAGRYRLHSQIGGGGMGTVWLARDELLGRDVAVKQVISPASTTPDEADQQRQRALREGRIAARLSHPHAISVYDVALEHGQPWLVMEYLPSRSLAAVLAEDGVLRVDQAAQIGAQVADALTATHAAGIVHRDVKPANILIGQGGPVEGLVKITDFGISHASGDITLTQTGQITGTPAFLAPEVAQGLPMTSASDVFSLGATLYACIEGEPPFGMEDNALGMLHRVAGGQIVPPSRAGAMAGPLLAMLAAEPGDRPTMQQVRDELATLAAGRNGDTTTVLLARTDLTPAGAAPSRTAVFGVPAATPAPPPRTPDGGGDRGGDAGGRAHRRAAWLWLAAGAAVVVLAGLIAFWAIQPNGNDSAGAQGSETAASSSAEPPASQPAATSVESTVPTSAGTTSEQSSPADQGGTGAPNAKDVRDFLRSYHQLVLEDPEKAYGLTGPTLRAAISEENYAKFWGQFSEVKLSDIQAEDGRTTATARVEFRYTDGTRQTEQHQFTFVVDDDQLILDSDEKIG